MRDVWDPSLLTSPERGVLTHAERLHQIGRLFFLLDDNADRTGVALAMRYSFFKPSESDSSDVLRESRESIYTVFRGEGGKISIVKTHQRVDLGFRAPQIEVGSPASEETAQFAQQLVGNAKEWDSMSSKEKTAEAAKGAMVSRILSHSEDTVEIDPTKARENKVLLIQKDLIEGTEGRKDIDLGSLDELPDDVGEILFSMEFSLLSQLQVNTRGLEVTDRRAVAVNTLVRLFGA